MSGIANVLFSVLQYNMMGESSELFVNCLEAMVETCLPVEEPAVPVPPSPRPYHLSSSLSSLTVGSPTDKGEILVKLLIVYILTSLMCPRFLAAFSLKAFSTESLDNDGVPGNINSLRRHSCTKNRGLSAAATKRDPPKSNNPN